MHHRRRIGSQDTKVSRAVMLGCPKPCAGCENPQLFSDEDRAMVDMGLGKNMVRSARFWAQAAGMTALIARGAGYRPTDLGLALLGQGGLRPIP